MSKLFNRLKDGLEEAIAHKQEKLRLRSMDIELCNISECIHIKKPLGDTKAERQFFLLFFNFTPPLKRAILVK
jgi:hypothetical protein